MCVDVYREHVCMCIPMYTDTGVCLGVHVCIHMEGRH